MTEDKLLYPKFIQLCALAEPFVCVGYSEFDDAPWVEPVAAIALMEENGGFRFLQPVRGGEYFQLDEYHSRVLSKREFDARPQHWLKVVVDERRKEVAIRRTVSTVEQTAVPKTKKSASRRKP